ncbi:MAG: hypothetical protein COB66_09205 [Coxiella sp. (in: Bacteria)]|nr:MAG: hypothetical protein COB66_09205 [Coxiella sp. (in: g-proteobacteria)]
MIKKLVLITITAITLAGLVGCSSKKENKNIVTVGTVSGPETELMEVAKKVALKRYGLDIQIIPFSDYNGLNPAVVSGSLDANAFQHKPFLDAQNKARHFTLVPIGKTFIFPIGIYSHKIKSLAQLKDGDKVAIPNDPTNESRALLLLQKAGLIKIKKDAGVNATPDDIISNPKHLKFIELDAAQLPRVLPDATLVAINTTYAKPAGLSPIKDALIHEDADSPYVNLIVVAKANAKDKKLLELVKAYQSKPVIEKAKQLFGDAAIPGWKQSR